MKKLITSIISLIVSITLFSQVPQESYVRLDDASGITPTSTQLSQLKEAADSLIAALPPEFQNQFRVYDFGFYLHVENYSGYGYPEVFEKVRQNVENITPYYLIFGKQTDRTGVYSKIWVDVKLPETGNFSCMTPFQRQIIPEAIYTIVNNQENLNGNFVSQYINHEKFALDSLKNKVNQIVNCCKKDISCNCYPKEEEIHSYLINKGFGYADLDDIIMNDEDDPTFDDGPTSKDDILIDYTNCQEIVYKGIPADLYPETLSKLLELQTQGYTVKGYIVDFTDCGIDFDYILNDVEQYDFAIVHYLYIREPPSNVPLGENFKRIYTYIWEPANCVQGENTTTLPNNPTPYDLTIYGTNESYVKMDLPIGGNSSFSTNVDFGGQYEISNDEDIEGSRLAIGYQISGNCTWVTGGGPEFSVGDTWLLFTNGDYKYYPYEYVFHELSVAGGLDVSIDASIEFVVAWNFRDCGSYLKPDSLAGSYEFITMSGSGGYIAHVGGTYQLDIPGCWAMDQSSCPAWFSGSAGLTAGVGLFPADFSLGTSLIDDWTAEDNNEWDLGGDMYLLTPVIKNEDRSLLDWVIQYARFMKLLSPTTSGLYITKAYKKAANPFNN